MHRYGIPGLPMYAIHGVPFGAFAGEGVGACVGIGVGEGVGSFVFIISSSRIIILGFGLGLGFAGLDADNNKSSGFTPPKLPRLPLLLPDKYGLCIVGCFCFPFGAGAG